jgi:multiple sugar transport system permease protein
LYLYKDFKPGSLFLKAGELMRLRKEEASAFLLLSPSTLLYVVFLLIPTIIGLGLSFYKWDMMSSPEFVGLQNWGKILEMPQAMASILNTIIITVIAVPLTIIVGLALALLVNKLPWGKMIFRSVFFSPVVASLVVMSIVWNFLYSTQTGYFNYLLKLMGFKEVAWLTDPKIAILSVIIMLVWHNSGYNMLIFLAGLQVIDESLYESAKIDGAGKFYIFWKLTLPLLSPVMFFIVITSTISNLQTFEAVYLLTGGGPGYATTTLVYFIVNAAFKSFDMGLAATLSIVLFALIALVTFIQWKFQDKWVHYD